VVVRDRNSGGVPVDAAADLVVDATGRASRTPSWLAEHGYDPPRVDEVPVDIAYSTIAIERPPEDRRVLLAPASAPHARGGAAFPIEGDQWLVNLHGMHGDHPPTDLAGFALYADSLPAPGIARLLAEHDWVSEDVAHYSFPSNRRRYDEGLDRFPTASSSSATPSLASTPSTPRACRSRR